MQQNSFCQGCNNSNCGITDARTGWGLSPAQDIDTVLINRYGVNVNVNVDDTFSLLYNDLYLRQQVKETMKHTMLVHESVFESQIHELHRLYRRQKELMKEMEGSRRHAALYLNPSFPGLRSHWMNSNISTYQTRNLPYEENIPNQIEAVDNVEKSEKKVLDLELPVFEYNEIEEKRSSMSEEVVHEGPDFLKEQSPRRMYLESGNESNKLQLDLNEPAKIEEHSDNVFSQFLRPVTSHEIGEESNTKNEGEDSVMCSNRMNEAQGSVNCREEYGIDLNMSPLSSEGVTIVKKLETEKPQESLLVSLHGKHCSEQPPVVIQALPCPTSILLLKKRYQTVMRGSRPRKKVKHDPSNKTFIGSDLYPHLSTQATSEFQSCEVSMEKWSSSSLSKEKSIRNQTNPGKKRRCKPQMKSRKGHKVILRKSGRIKRKNSRRISLVTEEKYQEISAAEAIVNMSRNSGREAADCITYLSRNLLWFAEISSSVAEGYEIDLLEGMTLQLTEKKLEEHETYLRLNSSDNEAAVSSIVLGKRRRSRPRQGNRKCKDDQHDDILDLSTFSECEPNEDLHVVGKLTEASELKWNCGFSKNKSKSYPPKPKYDFTSSVEEKAGVDWGAIKKRRRGSRIPATDFKHMIINQVVQPKLRR